MIDDKIVFQNFDDNADKLLTLLRRAYRRLMPAGMNDPYGTHGVRLERDVDIPYISMDSSLIEIVPATITVKTIADDREVPGFVIQTYKYYPGNHICPPDVEEVELADAISVHAAAQEAMKHLLLQLWEMTFDDLRNEEKTTCNSDSTC